jgi:NADPH:quinone reductase-like Zn-dependent oxidoreductase
MTATNASQLEEIASLIESGRVRPVVTKTFPLDEAAAAQRYVEREHPRGKVVLCV